MYKPSRKKNYDEIYSKIRKDPNLYDEIVSEYVDPTDAEEFHYGMLEYMKDITSKESLEELERRQKDTTHNIIINKALRNIPVHGDDITQKHKIIECSTGVLQSDIYLKKDALVYSIETFLGRYTEKGKKRRNAINELDRGLGNE